MELSINIKLCKLMENTFGVLRIKQFSNTWTDDQFKLGKVIAKLTSRPLVWAIVSFSDRSLKFD